MEPATIGVLLIAGLIVLLVVGVPIGFALLISGAIGIVSLRGTGTAEFMLGNFPYSGSASLALIIVPLFFFMGHLSFIAGLSEKAYAAARAWTGHISGGLPIATVFACAAFGTVCGSSVATAATLARVAVPEMLRAHYPQRMAAGCVAAAGTLGVLIPPSGSLMLYSIATDVPISDLFIGALGPGLLTVVVYSIGLYLLVRLNPKLRAATLQPAATWGNRFRLTAKSWEVAAIFALVMGGIYSGLCTATEAAALGAAAAFAAALRNRAKWRDIRHGLIETGSLTSAIFLVIVGAGIFGIALATSRIPVELAKYASQFHVSKELLLCIIVLPYLFLGCIIDAVSMIFLTLPVVYPVVKEAGINPILFGIIVCKMTEIGAITPPLGLNVFVVQGAVPNLKLREIFIGTVPFMVMELLIVATIILVPEIVTFPLRKSA